MGLDAVRWVPVTTATQVHLLRIDVNGVPCVLPEALGYGCPEWHWMVEATGSSHFRCQCFANSSLFRDSPTVVQKPDWEMRAYHLSLTLFLLAR